MATSTRGTVPLTQRAAWTALREHHGTIRDVHLRTLFADDPARGERLAFDAVGLYFDYSKNRVTDETIRLLLRLAEESGLRDAYRRDVRRREAQHRPRTAPSSMSRCGRRATPRSWSTART